MNVYILSLFSEEAHGVVQEPDCSLLYPSTTLPPVAGVSMTMRGTTTQEWSTECENYGDDAARTGRLQQPGYSSIVL